MLEFAVNILSCCDLGITNFSIDNNNQVMFYHGKLGSLPMNVESSGTIRLYCILVGMYKAIKTKGIAIWDEGFKLHFMIVKHLINMFYRTEAQLIIATNIELEYLSEDYRLIRESQIYIVGKIHGLSTVQRLDRVRRTKIEKYSYITSL